jgi:anti-sigma factor RsiW
MIDPHAITCRELVEFLHRYLDGELGRRRRAVFDAHLGACEECAAYLRDYETTVRLGREAFAAADAPVPDDVPEDLVRAVLAARKTSER